jgi:ATP-dependent exoDNAse (exonuclease V) beta subunit
MARMHPEEIEGLESPTEGELKVYRFLREAARLTRLLYGAITRAKYRLVMPYVEETEFIKQIKRGL